MLLVVCKEGLGKGGSHVGKVIEFLDSDEFGPIALEVLDIVVFGQMQEQNHGRRRGACLSKDACMPFIFFVVVVKVPIGYDDANGCLVAAFFDG